ncbi:MAG TPA: DUF1559 domain-containing protein [Pirellulaceae bacterium]|nr:DUF1559 domain-containing protein [Pirellulaceae bacterium]HMO91233.1 DUF1559 domain-containing protein [Pirellulaceae bacterium]HMP68583.1 DUF1559 domain-containing protein [Pirellulaceae bacterium]
MKKTRHAFTLIELLVVIAVIGILMALLMPAVQMVREAARRTNCLSNIRNIGVAMHNFEGALNRYPEGWIERNTDCSASVFPPCASYRYGWATLLLPYVEGGNIYGTYNISAGYWNDPSTPTVEFNSAAGIEIYTCPSDPEELLNPLVEQGMHAKLNYVGSIGQDYMDNFLSRNNGGSGMFFMNSRVRHRDIRDGTSHVISHAERSGTPSGNQYRNLGIRIGLVQDGAVANDIDGVTFPGLELANQLGQGPFDPTRYPGVPMDHRSFGIKGKGSAGVSSDIFAYTAGYASAHPGGISVLFADGSTMFMNETITVDVFARLLNIADGGVLSEDDYR